MLADTHDSAKAESAVMSAVCALEIRYDTGITASFEDGICNSCHYERKAGKVHQVYKKRRSFFQKWNS